MAAPCTSSDSAAVGTVLTVHADATIIGVLRGYLFSITSFLQTLHLSAERLERFILISDSRFLPLFFDYLRSMEYGISNLAIIPMRKEAREQSEMVSQLLFGEVYEIMERTEKWARIIAAHDGYEGWISFNQVTTISEGEYQRFAVDTVLTNKAISAIVKQSDGTLVYIPFGSALPGITDNVLKIGEDRYELKNANSFDDDVATLAQTFLNTPYLWGGRTHFGIDCSGLVQAVFRQHGLTLKRDAYLQAEQGNVVDFLPEAKAGDVAFFDNDEGRIVHVGIMLNNEQIIHASGRVKIERIDGQGIYSEEFKRYTHKLRIIKRYF